MWGMGWTRVHSSEGWVFGGWDEECALVQYDISCAYKVSIEPGDENDSVSAESKAGEETPGRSKLFER